MPNIENIPASPLTDKMVEIISSIQSATKSAGDFALSQLPDLAQSYVRYGRVKTAVLCGMLMLFAIICISVFTWAYRNPWNPNEYWRERGDLRGEANIVVMVLSLIGAVAFFIISITSFDFLVWFAPKVWLLKELAALVK
jgi:hypothetical protein